MLSGAGAEESLPAATRSEVATLTIESVFREHYDHIYRVVGRMLGPSATAPDIDDVTQHVFMAVHRALPGFRGESKLATWLYGIASNVVLTHLRSWRRQYRLKRALELAELTAPHARTPEQDYAAKQELVQVWRALLRVKPDKRIVYVLFEIEGLSGKEIAEAIQVPEATVYTRLHHARLEVTKALMSLKSGRQP